MREKKNAKKGFLIKLSSAMHSVKEAIHPSSVTWLSWKDTKSASLRATAVMCVCAGFAVGADALIGLLFSLVI